MATARRARSLRPEREAGTHDGGWDATLNAPACGKWALATARRAQREGVIIGHNHRRMASRGRGCRPPELPLPSGLARHTGQNLRVLKKGGPAGGVALHLPGPGEVERYAPLAEKWVREAGTWGCKFLVRSWGM